MYRDVPVVVYETAFREEDETIYQTEYDIRTRDVPVTTYVDGFKSYDSGDGVESEPGYGLGGPGLGIRDVLTPPSDQTQEGGKYFFEVEIIF